jgi:hypothetical protein
MLSEDHGAVVTPLALAHLFCSLGVFFNLAAYQNLSNRLPTLPRRLPNGDFDVAYPHDIWPASHMQNEVKLLLNPNACDEFTDRIGACTEEGWVAIETAS